MGQGRAHAHLTLVFLGNVDADARDVRGRGRRAATSTWRRSTWFSKASACSLRAARRVCCGSAIAGGAAEVIAPAAGTGGARRRARHRARAPAVPSASHARPLARVAPAGSRPRACRGAGRSDRAGPRRRTPRCTKADCRRRVPPTPPLTRANLSPRDRSSVRLRLARPRSACDTRLSLAMAVIILALPHRIDALRADAGAAMGARSTCAASAAATSARPT